MSLCKYVKKIKAGYEYGYMRLAPKNKENEKDVYLYERVGDAPTYEKALAANSMALEGNRGLGYSIEKVWRDLP